MLPNPYQAPETETLPNARRKRLTPLLTRLGWIVLPVLAGMVVGQVFLAPWIFGPADQMVYLIPAGLGGFIGLAIGLVLRVIALR